MTSSSPVAQPPKHAPRLPLLGRLPPLTIRQYALLLVPLVILILILIVGLRNFVREAIAIPISYIVYVGGILFSTFPQSLFLGLLVLVILYIGLRSLIPEKTDFGEPPPYELHYPARARVTFWALQVRMLRGSNYARNRFSQFLSKLTLEVLAHQQQLTTRQVESEIEVGALEIPPEVKLYLHSRQLATFSRRKALLDWLKRTWSMLLGRPPAPEEALDQTDLEKVVSYLEEQLEIKHE